MKSILLFLLLHLSFFSAYAAEDTSKNTKVPLEKPSFIKLSDITQEAANITMELKRINELLNKKKNDDIHEAVTPYCDSLSSLLKSKNYQNITERNVRELQKMQNELAVYLKQLEEWDVPLKAYISIHDNERKLLKNHSTLWKQTKKNALKEKAPQAILTHISSIILNIKKLKEKQKIKYDEALTDLQIVTTKILTIKELDSALHKNEELAKNQIFYQNQAPLFELFKDNNLSLFSYLGSIDKTIKEKFDEMHGYFYSNKNLVLNFAIAISLVFTFVLYFYYLYRKKTLFVKEESIFKSMFFFISRSISTFFILSILLIVAIFTDRPKSVIELQLIIIILPMIRILQTIIKKEVHKYIYAFFLLFVFFNINNNAVGYEFESRIFLLLLNTFLIVNIFYVYTKKVLFSIKNNFVVRLGNYILLMCLFLLGIAFFANFIGTVLLSSRILNSVFILIYASMIFYVIYTILTGYVVIILRRRISSASHMIEKYSKNIEKNIRIFIKIWMFSWWLLIILRLLGIYPYVLKLKDDILALTWNIAQTSISIQSIFDFLFIVFITWVTARLTRIILEVEIFARFTLPRGIPTAILTILNYIIVISGTVISLSSLGVSSQQFTLIFGALGVGIGFGLRNIIANFVSGIIMVFERPVQLGDVIEVDKTMGSVQSIGARSSTIKTFDGSEVIIPNADFIAKEITNWTLSDEHRRKIVNFKVAFGSDIELVLKIMKDISSSHKDVLIDPQPLATFQGFGEYYLEFKLYFWLSDNLIEAHSDISISIYKALKENGIQMPIQKTEFQGNMKEII